MKRIPSSLLFIILCVLLLLPLHAPVLKADVWISPMKILAEGYITDDTTVYTEKSINLLNDANQTYIVSVQWNGISILLDNQTIELQPFEKRSITPKILVEKGNHTGTITIKVNVKNSSKNQTGVRIITLSSISVTTKGYENTSFVSQSNNSEVNQLINIGFLYLPALGIIGVAFVSIMYFARKKIKNNNKKP